jgi:hypothetical protein
MFKPAAPAFTIVLLIVTIAAVSLPAPSPKLAMPPAA